MEITTCIVCCEEGSLIKYKHRCGTWYIHQKCLDDWAAIHSNECIICREYIKLDNRLALEIDIETNQNNEIVQNGSNNNNMIESIDVILLYFCIIFLIFLLILGFGGILIINIFNIPI